MAYMMKILRINLNSKDISEEPLDMQIVQEYLGGRGYGVKLLYDELPPKIDPLSAQNKIALMTGPMTGTNSPTASRWCMVFKSPLTKNTLNDTHCGGSLGIQLKKAGYDGIIIEGVSSEPC
ncbi:MAG: aldehyde ferredoxin oxidoreductase N-terminal domain-containing protein, partial [Promethearchaeota archaeon]